MKVAATRNRSVILGSYFGPPILTAYCGGFLRHPAATVHQIESRCGTKRSSAEPKFGLKVR